MSRNSALTNYMSAPMEFHVGKRKAQKRSFSHSLRSFRQSSNMIFNFAKLLELYVFATSFLAIRSFRLTLEQMLRPNFDHIEFKVILNHRIETRFPLRISSFKKSFTGCFPLKLACSVENLKLLQLQIVSAIQINARRTRVSKS